MWPHWLGINFLNPTIKSFLGARMFHGRFFKKALLQARTAEAKNE
jgi:hypothetical protein